ncbi:MAG: FMN-binding protein [Clostridia bacterium]|nr:FMN-binding protein [Clostridia bacterium]
MDTNQKTKKKLPVIQIVRALIQLAAFVLVPGLFIKIFSAVSGIYTAVLNGAFTFSAYAGSLLLVGAALLITLIWGRFFCGFLCSFGALQDLLWVLGRRVSPIGSVPEKADRALKCLKYGVLLFVVLGVWTFAVPGDSVWSPWTVFGALTSFGTLPAKEIVFSVGGLLLLLTVVGSLLVERFFCRYLCPLGAVFALVSRVRLFRIKRDGEKCGGCRRCTRSCSMGIGLYKTGRVCSGECIDCMKCVSACPAKRVKAEPVPAVSGTLAAAALAGMTLAGPIPFVKEAAPGITAAEAETVKTGLYADGVYTGAGQGYKGKISVRVTVENGYISDVTVLSARDDGDFFATAESGVVAEILRRQSADVDTVTGATFSSRGLIEAVKSALASGALKEAAASEPETTAPSDETTSEAPETTTSAPETTTAAPESTTSVPETTTETPETTTSAPETTTAAPETTTAAPETTTSAPDTTVSSGKYADGVYTGSGSGLRGTTSVRVTVENGAISDITVTSYQDDSPYFSRAQAGVIPAILSSQGVNVSTVSGATFSSNSILEAVADALGLTFTNPNSTLSSHGGKR